MSIISLLILLSHFLAHSRHSIFFFFLWSIIALHYCVSAVQLYVYIYPFHLEPPSHLHHPTLLAHHGTPGWGSCVIPQLPTSYVFHTWGVHTSMLLSQGVPTLFPFPMAMCTSSTSASLFLPCKQAQMYHLSRFHIHALINDICFSLFDLLHSVWQNLGPSPLLHMTQLPTFFMAGYYSIVYMYHILSVHSSVDRHLDCLCKAIVLSICWVNKWLRGEGKNNRKGSQETN